MLTMTTRKRGDNGMAQTGNPRVSGVAVALFAVCIVLGCIGSAMLFHVAAPPGALRSAAPLIAGGAIGIYLLFSIRVANQWEKVAVLRFGKYVGLRGPGMFHLIPVIDTLGVYVDQR